VNPSEETPFGRRQSASPLPDPRPRWLQTPVRVFMRPGVVSVSEEASVLQVERAMTAHDVHAVLVMGTDGVAQGWITAGGLLSWLGEEPAMVPARVAITEQPRSIPPTASAADALKALADPAVTHLLVAPRPDAPAHGVVAEIDLVRLASTVGG
jgi:CBS domain-containing protein